MRNIRIKTVKACQELALTTFKGTLGILMHVCVCVCCVHTSLMCVLRMGTMPATVLNLSTSDSSTCSIHSVWEREIEKT